jgi:hypothetical protein
MAGKTPPSEYTIAMFLLPLLLAVATAAAAVDASKRTAGDRRW